VDLSRFLDRLRGFVLLVLRGDRHSITRSLAPGLPLSEISAKARTAIVMPICNEDVPRVFAGLRATYESLARTGALERFDFFILSDTSDRGTRVAEVDAWHQMCAAVDGSKRVFYRWRQHRIKRKSGNIADFCRRWGRNYRYMIVLDADSVMSGECLARLVQLARPIRPPASSRPHHAPAAATRCSRAVQQFGGATYGPMFTGRHSLLASSASRTTGATTRSSASHRS
jgi:membrane glycosyltransferase